MEFLFWQTLPWFEERFSEKGSDLRMVNHVGFPARHISSNRRQRKWREDPSVQTLAGERLQSSDPDVRCGLGPPCMWSPARWVQFTVRHGQSCGVQPRMESKSIAHNCPMFWEHQLPISFPSINGCDFAAEMLSRVRVTSWAPGDPSHPTPRKRTMQGWFAYLNCVYCMIMEFTRRAPGMETYNLLWRDFDDHKQSYSGGLILSSEGRDGRFGLPANHEAL